MSTPPTICPCDSQITAAQTNLPDLSQIAFRAGDFNDFRRALLTPLLAKPGAPPLEQALTAWSSGVGIPNGANPAVADFAVMMVEWWAYLADILTFYNERIANEDYLRTSILPESASGLIRLLGYRPRPAIAATGTLAALITTGQNATLPAGLQFQSKPGPGQTPQIFELTAATSITSPDTVPATPATVLVGTPPPNLAEIIHPATIMSEASSIDHFIEAEGFSFSTKSTAATSEYSAIEFDLGSVVESNLAKITSHSIAAARPTAIAAGTTRAILLMQGTVTTVTSGTPLLLGTRDDTSSPNLIILIAPPKPQNTPTPGKQTFFTFNWTAPATALSASNARLRRANQTIGLWTVTPGGIASSTEIHLASVVRQIRPNDWIVLTAAGTPYLVQVASTTDVLWDAISLTAPTGPGTETGAINVLHTRLDLVQSLPASLTAALTTVLFDWVEFGALVDQPATAWDGSVSLETIQPASFPTHNPARVLLQDVTGAGAAASVAGGGATVSSSPAQTISPALQAPIDVFYNLLPVTRGKTVLNEIVGSGDATIAGQNFMLSKSPVTYLATGSTYASTISLTVNSQPWKEVASFYNQPANAQVFVTREDSQQNTFIDFGDGVNGSRIPTGANNIIASYRVGGGADSPAAGKLTVIAQSYPGLRAILNPVAVDGGSDPDPASLLRQYAPRSVLTFGRAVSILDYQALAAQTPGVNAAVARWSWDSNLQHAAVTVYIDGDVPAAKTALMAAGDPNRPISVLAATSIPVNLTINLIVTPGMDFSLIKTAVTTALADPQLGLFALANLGIGQTLFDSQIEAACLATDGVVAISSSSFNSDTGPIHDPGEGGFYTLTPDTLTLTTEADPNG